MKKIRFTPGLAETEVEDEEGLTERNLGGRKRRFIVREDGTIDAFTKEQTLVPDTLSEQQQETGQATSQLSQTNGTAPEMQQTHAENRIED